MILKNSRRRWRDMAGILEGFGMGRKRTAEEREANIPAIESVETQHYEEICNIEFLLSTTVITVNYGAKGAF